MGQGLPTEWPVFEDTKWYCVVVDDYVFTLPGCSGIYQDRVRCCQQGHQINSWIAAGWECSGIEICIYTGHDDQRLVHIYGPYDTQAECVTECV